MERNSVIAGLLLLGSPFLAAPSAWSAPPAPELRLIQTGDTTRVWMNESEISALSARVHLSGRCGGFKDVTDATPTRARSTYFLPFKQVLTEQAVVQPLLSEIRVTNLTETVKTLADFGTRYYQSQTGVQAAQWIQKRFTEYAAGRKDFSTELFKHRFAQPSVIARLKGKGPHADEIVVIGGHLDSINMNGNSSPNAPGADDDATGIATVLEVFRILASSGYQPERTLEFMGYAGEERGLLGSADIADKYAQDGKKVVAALQFDMTGFPGSGQVITLVTDHVSKDLTDLTKKLIDAYAKVPWKTTQCGYACSDHASWTDAGFASAFPFEAAFDDDNKAIHSARDTIEKIDFGFSAYYAKLALGYLVELGRGN